MFQYTVPLTNNPFFKYQPLPPSAPRSTNKRSIQESIQEPEEEDMPTTGDIKPSFQISDHGGWYLLNGRDVNTLPNVPQNNAIALGFNSNLPNANNAYISQGIGTLGTLNYENSKQIDRSELPNVSLSVSVDSDGTHTHTAITAADGSHSHNASTSSNGAHNHKVFANRQTSSTNNSNLDGLPNNSMHFAHIHDPANSNYLIKGDSDNTTPDLGVTSTNTSHSHSVTIENSNTHTHIINVDNSGTHTHTASTESINGNLSQLSFDKRPLTLFANYFIFLDI